MQGLMVVSGELGIVSRHASGCWPNLAPPCPSGCPIF
jgi:hypothetical protein